MWSFDAKVVDGAVNGTGWLTVIGSEIHQWFDTWIVDGAVNGSGWVVRQFGGLLRYLQSGRVQFYALFMVGGLVMFGLYKIDKNNIDLPWPMLTIIFVVAVLGMAIFTRASGRTKPADSQDNS